MADEIRAYSLLVPAGTPATAPARLDMTFPARQVDTIELVIPPGPNGYVGFQIQNSGLGVIPYDSDAWIVSNDEVISWPLDGYITSGSWQLAAYNTGTNDHTIYVRFLLSLVGAASVAAGAVLIPSGTLDSGSSDTADDGTAILDLTAYGS